jgi:predicted nucleic acid-binding Zn ribbon protein
MDSLIRTLPAILAASLASEEVAEAACIAAWKDAVGETLSRHAVPVGFQNKILVVAVEDIIWQRQLRQMCGQLLSRLNSVLGQPIVKSIELRIDAARVASSYTPPPSHGLKQRDYDVPSELLSAAAGITDVELRRAFLGAATSCINRLDNLKDKP